MKEAAAGDPDSDHHPSPRLFVMRAGAIGDFILTLPALGALRHKYATHHMLLAARGDVLPLVAGTLADEVVPFDSPLLTPLFAAGAPLPEALGAKLAATDLAVHWLAGNPARIACENLRRADVARLLLADPMPHAQHAADHLLGTLAPLGIGPRDVAPLPFLPANLPPVALPWDKEARIVALHVGSGGEQKRWPFDNFMALARRLAGLGDVRVLLLSGPAEEALGRALPLDSPSVAHVDSPDLLTLAAMLKCCALYVGNDSGITHLAAALGMPTLALFGPTDPAIWEPRGPRVSVIRSPTGRMSSLAVETVWQHPALCALTRP